MTPLPENNKLDIDLIYVTDKARDRICEGDIRDAVAMHMLGYWGYVSKKRWERNDQALINRKRVFSVYKSSAGLEFWLITEADRFKTTALMPEDYLRRKDATPTVAILADIPHNLSPLEAILYGEEPSEAGSIPVWWRYS